MPHPPASIAQADASEVLKGRWIKNCQCNMLEVPGIPCVTRAITCEGTISISAFMPFVVWAPGAHYDFDCCITYPLLSGPGGGWLGDHPSWIGV